MVHFAPAVDGSYVSNSGLYIKEPNKMYLLEWLCNIFKPILKTIELESFSLSFCIVLHSCNNILARLILAKVP